MIQLLKLSTLILCFVSCQAIELDWYAGNSNGYIENQNREKVYSNQLEFNEYACLNITELQRLAKWIKRNCR